MLEYKKEDTVITFFTSSGRRALFGSLFKGTVHHGREGGQQECEAAHYIVSTVRKQRAANECLISHFLLYIQSRIPTHGIVSATLRIGLPTSINPTQTLPHRHAHRIVSQVILEPVRLISNINHHRGCESLFKIRALSLQLEGEMQCSA